ncbi:MAG: hypothetical protein K9L89_05000 [Kiritimatiellales bacterium]|nr:hypothetical protein [Kiritimatiellales bacterium]
MIKKFALGLSLLVSISTSAQVSPAANDGIVSSIYGLKSLFVEQQYQFLPIGPPSEDVLVQPYDPVVPVDWKKFPKEFTKQMYAEMDANGFPLYRVSVFEDPVTRETVFLNYFGNEGYRLAAEKSYDPYLWQKDYFQLSASALSDPWERWIYDPAHVATKFTLVPEVFYESYVLAEEQRRLEQAVAMSMMMAMSGENTNVVVDMQANTNGLVTLSISLPSTFGKHVEIFSRDYLLYPELFQWEVAKSWLPTYGYSSVAWVDPDSGSRSFRYYIVSDADIDTDGDGYSDNREHYISDTDPQAFNTEDIDGDGMHDWYETKLFGGLGQVGTGDFDGDGLLNNQEMVYTTSGYGAPKVTVYTDPSLYDTDGDGMDDGFENAYYWLNPNNPLDGTYDRDGDGLPNAVEYALGTNLSNTDSDGDLMPDGWEVSNGLNPLSSGDATTDSDGDQLSNLEEYYSGTNPQLIDTDADGLSDYDESETYNATNWTGTSPTNPDTDGDGMPDGYEFQRGFDPASATDAYSDPDGDHIPNLYEFHHGTEPSDPFSLPAPTAVVGTNGLPATFATIQAGVGAVATNDWPMVLIEPGTYRGTGNRNIHLNRANILVYGTNSFTKIDCEGYDRAFCIDSGKPVVSGLLMENGHASGHGGAIYSYSDAPLIRNCVFSGNTALYDGGAVYLYGGSPAMENCTFLGNHAGDDGGAACGSGNLILRNCIAWGNSAVDQGRQLSGTVADHSCVEGGFAGTGNITNNPGFVEGTWQLAATNSPCYGAGTNMNAVLLDIDSDRREGRMDIGADQLFDSDGDGLSDWCEIKHVPPLNHHNVDSDGDGLDDYAEIIVYLSDPWDTDSDHDNLSDGDEVHIHGSHPVMADTDGDILDDGEEVLNYGSNPASADSDGDGLNDGDEVHVYSSNPAVHDSMLDGDQDDVLDIVEHLLGSNPGNPADPLQGSCSITVSSPLEGQILN